MRTHKQDDVGWNDWACSNMSLMNTVERAHKLSLDVCNIITQTKLQTLRSEIVQFSYNLSKLNKQSHANDMESLQLS